MKGIVFLVLAPLLGAGAGYGAFAFQRDTICGLLGDMCVEVAEEPEVEEVKEPVPVEQTETFRFDVPFVVADLSRVASNDLILNIELSLKPQYVDAAYARRALLQEYILLELMDMIEFDLLSTSKVQAKDLRLAKELLLKRVRMLEGLEVEDLYIVQAAIMERR